MFAKLERKFVIINMSLLSFVFIAIFSVVYMLTAVAGERQTDMILRTLMYSPQRPFPDNPAIATSIVAELDKEGGIIKTFSFINVEPSVVEEAVGQVRQEGAESGRIKVAETHYAYLIKESPNGSKLVLADRTYQHRTLMNLLFTFLVAGGISLILLFIISLYLAHKSVAPIKEAFEKQQQFVADASHELRTPLTVIKTNLALIGANSEETVKSQARWLDYISAQTDRMGNLVGDMLALARYDYQEKEQVFSPVDISRVVNSTLLAFEAVMFENGIKLEKQVEPGLSVTGHREGLEKLVGILADNAIKNTPTGGLVTVALKGGKNHIELRVSNTGPGIAAEHLERIFERFYRVDTARSRENGGYGLGLAIAKSIVDQHRGRIYAFSRPGVDTSFVVELLR